MSNNSFNDLLHALQSALIEAQEALKKRCADGIRKTYGNETNAVQSPVLTFASPQNGAGEDKYDIAAYPFSCFRAHRRPQISMLSLEFACELKKKKLSGPLWTYYLVIKKGGEKGLRQRNMHRMLIVFNGTYGSSCMVIMDDKLFMEIPCCEVPYKDPATAEGKESLFRKIVNGLQRIWQPQSFIMTEEQAKMVEEILQQRNYETQGNGREIRK